MGFWNDLAEKISKDITAWIDKAVDTPIQPSVVSAAIHVKKFCIDFKTDLKEHHTDVYQNDVFRRGQDIRLGLELDRPFNFNRDKCTLLLSYFEFDKTLFEIKIPLSDKKDFTRAASEWDVRFHGQNGAELTLYVRCPVSASVGPYYLTVVTEAAGQPTLTFQRPKFFIIIFNPWCKEDAVYMEDEVRRQEYVMNTCGKIFQGVSDHPEGLHWLYEQFDNVVALVWMMLFKDSGLSYQERSNPIKIVRALSTLVNKEDGLLEGKWEGDFSDGKNPTMWTGSREILWKYIQNDLKKSDQEAGNKNFSKKVKYGQCFVYGGLITTLCRAIGIPCRTVTCFDSAHDVDKNLMIDKYEDADGDAYRDPLRTTSDSCWNYHVWNDCWMTRPDLRPGYGGWQVVDGTPQEEVNGIFRCGPCSLQAVKKGQVDLPYDAPFIFAEVNSDTSHWLQKGMRHTPKYLYTITNESGSLIVTKRPGVCDHEKDTDLEDITDQYKYPEGTEEERMAVQYAAQILNVTDRFQMPKPENQDCKMTLEKTGKVHLGDPLRVAVRLDNRSNEERLSVIFITLTSVYYNGNKGQEIHEERYVCELAPNQSKRIELKVNYEDYCDQLVDMAFCKIHAHAKVDKTNQTWHGERTIKFAKPKLTLTGADSVRKGEVYVLEISFQNPLDRYLRDCVFAIEGSGFTLNSSLNEDNFSSPFDRDIEPLERVSHTVELVPNRTGEQGLVVRFNSDRLSNLSGAKEVKIF